MCGLAILAIASALLPTVQGAQPPARAALSALSAHFQCPEALPNDAARQRALHDFYDAYAQIEPAAPIAGASVYRHVLLETHVCKQTPPPRVRLETGFSF